MRDAAADAWDADVSRREAAAKLQDVKAYVDRLAGDNEGRATEVLMDLLRLTRERSN